MRRTIDGIPCTIRSRKVEAAIRTVFAAIQRHPRDWNRLRTRLLGIDWLPREEGRDGTMGEWVADADFDYPGTEEHFRTRGEIWLSRTLARYPLDRVIATVAHECGHVATRWRDFDARERVSGDSEWSSELCADMYAFRWGFEQQIRADGPHRALGHHCAPPGEVLGAGINHPPAARFCSLVSTGT
jgi:hypothetical protein